jgi:hypothetical protein
MIRQRLNKAEQNASKRRYNNINQYNTYAMDVMCQRLYIQHRHNQPVAFGLAICLFIILLHVCVVVLTVCLLSHSGWPTATAIAAMGAKIAKMTDSVSKLIDVSIA